MNGEDQYQQHAEALLPPLLTTLEMLTVVGRRLHPSLASQLADWMAPQQQLLGDALASLHSVDTPADYQRLHEHLAGAAEEALNAVSGFVTAAHASPEPMGMYRALRHNTRAVESLYPLSQVLRPVSRLFVEPAQRDNDALFERLQSAVSRSDTEHVGIINGANGRDERGGFTLYVPEYYDGSRRWPVVFALHGGSGHGADFIWSWLREARTRGCLVVAPTSVDRTWSIMEPQDNDLPNLLRILDFVRERYIVDESRMLLTGMSDGGTYTLLGGLDARSPFTHLAPFSGVLHPFLMMNGNISRAAGKPIYLVHGALDWMFDVARAREGADLLRQSGAQLIFREIEDLAHTYARDENAALLDWFGVPAP